jgi:hypothetical protein
VCQYLRRVDEAFEVAIGCHRALQLFEESNQLEARAQMNNGMLQVDLEFSQDVPYILTDSVDPMEGPWLDGG